MQVLRTGSPVYGVEMAITRPDGAKPLLSISAIPLRNSKGEIIATVESFNDITEKKRNLKALEESELRFRKILESIELIALTVDIKGNLTLVNDYFLKLIGFKRKQVIGKPSDIFIAQKEKETDRKLFEESIIGGEVLPRYETEIVSAGGVPHTISFANVLLQDANGNTVGTAHIGYDITERKRVEQEIVESRKQVLDVLESISDAFFAMDNDWRFTYVNQKAVELINKRREEVLYRNMWQVLPQTVGTRFDVEYHKAKEEMAPLSFEEYYDPIKRWLEVHVHPYKNGISVYISDVTRRKEVEEELRESEERYRALVELSPERSFSLTRLPWLSLV